MKNIFLIAIIVLSSIYTISYAKHEIKEKRVTSAVMSVALVIVTVLLFIIKSGLPL